MTNNNAIIKTKLLRGEYWDVVKIQNTDGIYYTIINTGQKEGETSGATSPKPIRTFENEEAALDFLDEIINFGDAVEVEMNDGQKLEGTFIRCAGVECGVDFNGQQICIENGFGILGKMKDDKDGTVADWTIKPEQCKNIKRISK